MSKSFNKTINIGLLGWSGAGKTSLIRRFTHSIFEPNIISSMGIDKTVKKVTLDGEEVTTTITDTAGQERYGGLVSTFFRRLNRMMFVYAINSKESFDTVLKWIDTAKEYVHESYSFIIVGNKVDLDTNVLNNQDNENYINSKREVSEKDGKELADSLNCPFFETSAKEDINVTDAFMCLINNVYNIKKTATVNSDTSSQITLDNKNKTKKNCSCKSK